MTINDLRDEIDKIDLEIIKLLGARSKIVEKVGCLKENKQKIKDTRRERQILRKLRKYAEEHDLDPEFIEQIYRQFFDYFVKYQFNSRKQT